MALKLHATDLPDGDVLVLGEWERLDDLVVRKRYLIRRVDQCVSEFSYEVIRPDPNGDLVKALLKSVAR